MSKCKRQVESLHKFVLKKSYLKKVVQPEIFFFETSTLLNLLKRISQNVNEESSMPTLVKQLSEILSKVNVVLDVVGYSTETPGLNFMNIVVYKIDQLISMNVRENLDVIEIKRIFNCFKTSDIRSYSPPSSAETPTPPLSSPRTPRVSTSSSTVSPLNHIHYPSESSGSNDDRDKM